MDAVVAPTFATAPLRFVTSHFIDEKTLRVFLTIRWYDDATCSSGIGIFDEFHVQDLDERLVLGYWEGMGGRCETTKLKLWHVFRIIDEKVNKYKVQWTGYGEKDSTWESKKYVVNICSDAVVEWENDQLDD